MLNAKVKVTVTNLSDARYCAGMGVDYLVFPADHVSPQRFKEMAGWVSGPQLGISLSSAQTPVGDYEPDFIEGELAAVSAFPAIPALLRITSAEWQAKKEQLKNQLLGIELLLNDGESTEAAVKNLSTYAPVFLRVRQPEHVQAALSLNVGFSLEGEAETRPGLKEYGVQEILEQLEAD